MKSFFVLCSTVFFFCFGFYISSLSNHFPFEVTEYERPARRDPAAIKRVYDFSHLEGGALSFATKQRLLTGIKVVGGPHGVGLELGHFVIKTEDGQKTFACQRYQRIVLEFKGDGSAVAGESPKMEVEGDCQMSSDINSISALEIPVSQILAQPANDGEFDFRSKQSVKVRFSNVADQWPVSWQLISIRLYNAENPQSEVIVSTQEIHEITSHPVILNF